MRSATRTPPMQGRKIQHVSSVRMCTAARLPRTLLVRTANPEVPVLGDLSCTSSVTPPNSPNSTATAVLGFTDNVNPSPNTSSAPAKGQPFISSSPSACPFLASLPVPPVAHAPWGKKLLQFTDPPSWQEAAVGGRDVVEATFLLQPVTMPCTAANAKVVLTGEGDYTTVGWPDYFDKLFGPGALILVSGERHRLLRALMQPAFTAEALAEFVPSIVSVVERYMSRWAAADGAVPGQEQLKLLTFEIIIQVVLGQEYTDTQVQELSDLCRTWLGGMFTLLPFDLPFLPFGHAMRAREQLGMHIQAAITRAREQQAAGQPANGIVGNLVRALDEHGNSLTDSEIEDNVVLMLFAGHDTSSCTLALTLAHLTNHPHVVQRLRQEQEDVAAAHGGKLDAAALKAMPYAEAVIRETLRVTGVVGGVLRKASKDFELGGFRIPQGSGMLVPLTYLARHDPRWTAPKDMPPEVAAQQQWGEWPREEFNPDLLLTEQGQKQGWLLPFGAGNRYCLGAPLAMVEMKVFLAVLARGFKAVADTDTTWSVIPMPQPKNGLPLTVARLRPAA